MDTLMPSLSNLLKHEMSSSSCSERWLVLSRQYQSSQSIQEHIIDRLRCVGVFIIL